MHTERPGVNIPAVTTKFERAKHDIRKGSKTGLPVSVSHNRDRIPSAKSPNLPRPGRMHIEGDFAVRTRM